MCTCLSGVEFLVGVFPFQVCRQREITLARSQVLVYMVVSPYKTVLILSECLCMQSFRFLRPVEAFHWFLHLLWIQVFSAFLESRLVAVLVSIIDSLPGKSDLVPSQVSGICTSCSR